MKRSKVRCAACDAENSPDDAACLRCGLPLAAVEPRQPGTEITCPRCQSQNNAGAFFCYTCGKYFADMEEARTGKSSKKKPVARPRSASRAAVIMPGGSEITLTGMPVFIERSDFDSKLPHEVLMAISRQHILITYNRGKYYVQDYGREGKGSTNHTRLNGRDIYHKTRRALKDGDKIELAGQPELTITFRSQETPQ